MRLLLIDNYDSFTYNLAYMIRATGVDLEVRRNDKLDLDIHEFDGLILSPGPGIPEEAGELMQIIQKAGRSMPVLGVCLGHQAIAESFGAELYNLPKVYHGVQGSIYQSVGIHKLFKGVPRMFEAGRYHSWAVRTASLPSGIQIIAVDGQDEIMAIRVSDTDIYGIQFHPESILTPEGKTILNNFLTICKNKAYENAIGKAV